MDTTPDIGSPDWRYWVIAKLESIVRGDVADVDIAAIVGTTGSETRKQIDAMIAASDSELTLMLSQAIQRAVDAASVRGNRYADAVAENALTEAKRYTDENGGGSSPGGVSKEYVDSADNATLESAKDWTDTQTAEVLRQATDYSDNESDKTLTSANLFATNADKAILESAKDYADEVASGGSGGGVSEQFVTDAVAQGVTDAGTAATLADNALRDELTALANSAADGAREAAGEYTDTTVATALSGVTGEAQNMANAAENNAKAYADDADEIVATNVLAAVDGKVSDGVAQANAYTDDKIANSGLSKAYVDNGDASTLAAAAADAGNKATNALASAKTYTDNKFTDTGWVPITPASGASWAAGSNFGCRTKNGTNKMRGQFTSSNNIAAATNIGPLIPDGMRPTQGHIVKLPGTATTDSTINVRINANGTIDVLSVSGAATTGIRFDNVVYDVN